MKLNKDPRGSLGVATLSGFMVVIFLLAPFPAFASLSIDAPLTTYTIDFSGFTGSGFVPEPAAGQLDSDTWRVSGLSDGDLVFGGTAIGATYTRGTSTGGVTPGGIYAFTVSPGVTALGVQPTNGEFTPGEFVLRLMNNTGGTITQIDVDYDLWVRNDENMSSSFDFAHSPDDSSYTTLINYSSVAASDTNGWTKHANSTTISVVSVTHGGFYYLRWNSDDAGGSGPKRDELGLTNIQVSVTVDYPPDAVDDSDTTSEDTPVTIDVLGNDTHAGGDTLLLDSFTQPVHGTVTREENGTPADTSDDELIYTPEGDWNGDDSFTYTISDGNGETDTANVDVSVTPVNDPPDAVDDGDTTAEDTPVTVDVLSNDTDPDGDTLLLDSFTQPVHGTVTREENGTPADTSDDELIYTPEGDWNGDDSFTYTISDGNGEMDTANVDVSVTPVNDPPDAVDDSDTTAEDTPVTIDALSNDSDPDGDTLLLDSFTQPANGTVTRDENGTPGDTSDDQLTYTPDAGWSGDDSFTYTISDENSDTDTATVTVTVEDPYPFKLYLPLILR